MTEYKAELSRLSVQTKLMPLRYKIFFKSSVRKDLLKVLKKDLKKVLARIESLAEEPCPIGCEKLSGQEKYRVRQGVYRILYSIQDNELTIWVVKVAHRRDVYR